MSDKARLLVIDDEAPMRELLRDFLVSQGYRVEAHASAAGALASLKASTGSLPAAMICHLQMTPMNGLDLLKIVKKEYPAVPFLIFTGTGKDEERDRALAMGADYFLPKPFSLTGLKTLLEESLLNGVRKQARKI